MDRFSRDGLSFDVRDGGSHEGAAVVLLHGFPQEAAMWAPLEPALHDLGLRTLAPDQRGYSPRARPGGRAAYQVGELVADVVALLDAAGLAQAHLVGHDWGGGVAWETAARHPERIASLTVLSTPHPAALSWAYRHDAQQRRMSWYMAAFQLPWMPERYLARRLFTTLRRSGMPPLEAARVARRFPTAAELAGPIAWYRALTVGSGPRQHAQPTPISVPTALVWGSRDVALGRVAAERTAAHVTGPYRFVELDAGHWLVETEPAAVLREIRHQIGLGAPG